MIKSLIKEKLATDLPRIFTDKIKNKWDSYTVLLSLGSSAVKFIQLRMTIVLYELFEKEPYANKKIFS